MRHAHDTVALYRAQGKAEILERILKLESEIQEYLKTAGKPNSSGIVAVGKVG